MIRDVIILIKQNKSCCNYKAYISIALGTLPHFIVFIFLLIGRPSSQPQLGIWIFGLLLVIITAPILGAIGVYIAKSAKKYGCNNVLYKAGIICSVLTVVIAIVPAFVLLFYILTGN